ncbi:MAG: putative glycoside hydrolase [Pseudomonadota bacterium]
MKKNRFLLIILFPVLAICIAAADGGAFEDKNNTADNPFSTVASPDDFSPSGGKVIDETTNMPLAGATVTLDGNEAVITDRRGFFPITHRISKIAARASGYTRAEVVIAGESSNNPLVEVRLKPFHARALYLTVYGIGSKVIRHKALALIKEQDLNALVIDVKGDRGFIPYPSDVPLAASIGAQKIKTVGDIKELVKSLKDDGIYTIARIVVFKDNLLGTSRPDLAVKTSDGKVWLDREQLIWVDASRKEVWDYNIQIAIEAAKNGFDEIQFDYVRFPDHNGLKFAVQNTEENRVASITGFLQEAQKRLQPYNVFLAADIFGYVPWNYDDTQIGQRIDKLVPTVDYISLMLYPSGFHLGIPGYVNSVANSYQIVYLTLKKAQERTKLPALRFRPWLQSFRDYAFDRREFTGVEIAEQIKAAEDFGSAGWMLWNPRNIYSPEGIRKKGLKSFAAVAKEKM